MATKKTRRDVLPAEARRIQARYDEGVTVRDIAKEFKRAESTIHMIINYPDHYQLPRGERYKKGLPIPRTRAEKGAQSLRPLRKPVPESGPYAPQISDNQVNFPFAIALLEKATEIVRVLATQEHPPELMALVSETIEAAVKMQVMNRIAEQQAAEDAAAAEAVRLAQETRTPYPLGGYMRPRPEDELVDQFGNAIED